jgi:hypothetical protein
MRRTLVWLVSIGAAAWWGLPLVAPRVVAMAVPASFGAVTVGSCEWIPGGIRLREVYSEQVRLGSLELQFGWQQRPLLIAQLNQGHLVLPSHWESSSTLSWPTWLAMEISLQNCQLELPKSGLVWSAEGALERLGSHTRVDLQATCGLSRIRASLQHSPQVGWSGDVDAESLPLPVVSELGRWMPRSVVGGLFLTSGTASGHISVERGLACGDVLIEHLRAEDLTLGLELGIEEGLLSLAGREGLHLNVSQQGWVRWGETGLQDLSGSILVSDRLELDLVGQLLGADSKKVQLSSRQEPDGWVVRLELLKIPVQSAIAEVAFRGDNASQSVIRLEHFGPEQTAWLSRVIRPFSSLPSDLEWTAQQIGALARVDWAAGHPCHLQIEDLQIRGLEVEHPNFGSWSAETISGHLEGPCDPRLWDGMLCGGAVRWQKGGASLLTEGQITTRLQPGNFPVVEASARCAGSQIALQLTDEGGLQVLAEGPWPALSQHWPLLQSLESQPIHRWAGCWRTDAEGSTLGLSLEGASCSTTIEGRIGLTLAQLLAQPQELVSRLPCSQLNFDHMPVSWQGEGGSAAAVIRGSVSWDGRALQTSAWLQEGLLQVAGQQLTFEPTDEPLFTGHLVLADPQAAWAWLPSGWKGDLRAQARLQGGPETYTAGVQWSEDRGAVQITGPDTGWHLAGHWDLAQENGSLRFAQGQQPVAEMELAIESHGPGDWSIRSLAPGGGEAAAVQDLQLEFRRWKPHRWQIEATLPMAMAFPAGPSWMQPQDASPSSSKARQLLQRSLPSRVQVAWRGLQGAYHDLTVRGADPLQTPWSFAIGRHGTGWQVQQGEWGPLRFAGELITAQKQAIQTNGQVMTKSGQPVLAVQAVDDEGIDFSLSREGLPLMLDDLSSWANGREPWGKWLRLKQDLTASLRMEPDRGWVLRVPELKGKIRAMPIDCRQIEVWSDADGLQIQGTFCNRGKSDPFQATLRSYAAGPGELIVKMGKEECRCGWILGADEGFQLLALHGGLLGQRAHFQCVEGRPGVLEGQIEADLQNLIPLLPDDVAEAIEKLSLGKGVTFQGLLNLQEDISLEGRLDGRECEAFGAVWDRLSADFYCSPTVLSLSGLHIQDPAGEIKAPLIEVREIEPKNWQLEIPLAGARQIRLSELRWPGRQKRSVKHLMMEEILLEKVQGPADKPQAWKGTGHVRFENEAPRPALLFLPAELLGNLGLDLALLEPVRGTVHFAFEDGMIRLKDFEDVVSIRNRSRFYLHPDPGFAVIGWDGTVNIRIWMKQFVVLKITQPLNLYITGNLKDPEISFQHSDKRCALTALPEPAENCCSQPPVESAESSSSPMSTISVDSV